MLGFEDGGGPCPECAFELEDGGCAQCGRRFDKEGSEMPRSDSFNAAASNTMDLVAMNGTEAGDDRCPICEWELEDGCCVQCGLDFNETERAISMIDSSVDDGARNLEHHSENSDDVWDMDDDKYRYWGLFLPDEESFIMRRFLETGITPQPAIFVGRQPEAGTHEDFDKGSPLPFTYIDRLGVGASAVVDLVEDRSSGWRYAHKVFRPYTGHDTSFKATFKNEIAIMKRLNPHPHIVEIYWSYTRGRELGMLLSPVASDRDLATYLLAIHDAGRPPTEDQQRTLLQAFGCLSNGLAYIHGHTIRHKDVKPHNILVHNGQMIFTDFGIAFDASSQATTTTGMAETFTKRYCAPEVIQNLLRNRSSDVFSLGCVFLEILAVLIPSIHAVLADPRPYCARVFDIRVNLTSLIEKEAHDKAAVIMPLCLDMIRNESVARIPARAIQERLVPSAPWRLEQYFCFACLQGAPKTPREHDGEYTGLHWKRRPW